VGDYRHNSPPYGITVRAGTMLFETDPANVDFLVEIANDHGTPARDNYLLRSSNNLPLSTGVLVDNVAWQLDDDTLAALSSTSLPTSPPRLSDWESIFGLTVTGSDPADPFGFGYFVRAHVVSAELCDNGETCTEVFNYLWIDQVTFVWDPDPGVEHYNVYRALFPDPGPPFSCFLSDVPVPTATDVSIPPLNFCYSYLVTGANPTCEGTLGFDSAGAARPNLTPCP
jgi:hypothetical protein